MSFDLEDLIVLIPFVYLGFMFIAYLLMRKRYP